MYQLMNAAVFVGVAAISAGAIGVSAQSGARQSAIPTQSPASQSSQTLVTLTGCLRQTSDDPKMLALVPSSDAGQPASTNGTMARSPLYRLEDKGQNLKGHVGQRVEVTGNVTPAKDEKGADIVMSRTENIGIDTVTVTTIDLKPAPRLDVTSVKKVPGECPSTTSTAKQPGGGGAGTATAVAARVGEISQHPERYLGQKVTVTGEVEQMFNPRVFSLDEDRVFSTGVDVLVVAERPAIAKDNQRVTVTGTVRRFIQTELQKEIIDFDLRPEWLVGFEMRPVILATDVTVVK